MNVARCEILDGASHVVFLRAVISSLWSPVMSLRIPVKADDFLRFSRRTPVHPVNVGQMSLASAAVI